MTERVTSPKTYSAVFAALLVLLLLSVWITRFDLGYLNTAIALGISAAKTILIVLFFMHLLHSPPLPRLAAASGLVWLAILLILTLSDYQTRAWQTDGATQPASVDRATLTND